MRRTDGRDYAAEEVQVDVAHGENRAEKCDTLRLREPREQDAEREDAAVEREEVDPALAHKRGQESVSRL